MVCGSSILVFFLKLYISTHIDSSNIGNIDVYGMIKENGLWQQYFYFLELYIFSIYNG